MRIKIAVVAAAFLTVMSLDSAAQAQASSGTISTKGPFAEADIFGVDSSGIYREIYVFSSTSTNHSPGGPSTGSAVTYAYYLIVDANTGTFLDEGFGYLDGTLTVGKKLDSASLTATGTATSFFDSSTHSVDVDLTFTPSGPLQTTSYVEHVSFGTIKFVVKFAGTLANALLSGSASLDDVALDTVYFADFGSSKSSQLTVTH